MMNGRHLPAGQGMPPDMGRRRQHNQQHYHQPHHPQQQQQYQQQMYSTYMQPYAANYYPQPLPPQYHNASLPQHYTPYPPPPYVRSPPPSQIHQQYAPPVVPQQQPAFSRPQASPVVSSDYKAPISRAPSSTRSSHTVPVPVSPPASEPVISVAVSPPPQEEHFQEESIVPPFKVPLPWLSRPDLPWPVRKVRRKRKGSPQRIESADLTSNEEAEVQSEVESGEKVEAEPEVAEQVAADVPERPETPASSLPVSQDADSVQTDTPSSTIPTEEEQSVSDHTVPATKAPAQRGPRPVLPVVPALPKNTTKEATRKVSDKVPEQVQQSPAAVASVAETAAADSTPVPEQAELTEIKEAAPVVNAWSKPKVWAGLFNSQAASTASTASGEAGSSTARPGFGKSNAESLADTLRCFDAVSNDSKIAFIEPRGLVNTGNMCYMNSVLQVLIFCSPFYSFLDQVSKRVAHSFKSETPVIDAMILFMQQYPIIDSAQTVNQLNMRLKESQLEKYGEAFTPDFVYNAINTLPRFSSMRRGHQQDAEEFLGFFLEMLHDECVQVMRNSASASNSALATPQNGPSSPISEMGSVHGSTSGKENGWLEVGPKQKAAVTRSSGTIMTGSPITKIFGGNLRSELRVPGMKDSVTLEPYQPLQLDIGSPNVNNIIDALKGLTRSEVLTGDFGSPNGTKSATKQVFIDTLPPVLILHLKRFQYDNAGGTQKIWKKVGYPLELEIPKEVFSRQKRNVYAHSGLPKYRLIAVVYHHGKNASGGHYTVDVRRQDGKEWIRLDDTVIRRVRSEEVAEGGSEEDPKVLAAALEAHKKDTNGFAVIEGVEDDGEEGWKKATSSSGKKWSTVANGASTPKAKSDKFSVKDNKVAYLLFYQKI